MIKAYGAVLIRDVSQHPRPGHLSEPGCRAVGMEIGHSQSPQITIGNRKTWDEPGRATLHVKQGGFT